MNIGIAGCGRFGVIFARALSSPGYSVVIIDRQENAFKALSYVKLITETEFSILLHTKNFAIRGKQAVFIVTRGGRKTWR